MVISVPGNKGGPFLVVANEDLKKIFLHLIGDQVGKRQLYMFFVIFYCIMLQMYGDEGAQTTERAL